MATGENEEKLSEVERFWSKVRPEPDGCWLFTGAPDEKGYGLFTLSGSRRTVRAHRYSYELHYGPLEPGLQALHTCDRPPCVRPDHLFKGTNADNVADREAKGRGARQGGQNNGNARLIASDVVAIRASLARGETLNALARRYGVTKQQISNIKHRKRWSEVAGG